jgi:hypothetical protein
MLNLSPRFFLSPRFLALPLIALGVIVALAQTGKHAPTANTHMAAPKIYRALNCANPANAMQAACAIAADDTIRHVR